MTRPKKRQYWDLIRVVPAANAPAGRRARDPVDVLETKVWFHHLKRDSHLSTSKIDAIFCRRTPDAEAPRLAYKWARGKVSPGVAHVRKSNIRWPGSADVLDWILWPLLRQTWIDEQNLLKMLAKYIHPHGSRKSSFYKFPGDPDHTEDEARCRHSTDVEALLNRRDHFGFMTILALVRYAEAARLPQFHLVWSVELFRAFPAMARHLDSRGFQHELLELVVGVVLRRPGVITEYAVDAEKLLAYADLPGQPLPGYDFLVPVHRILGRSLNRDVMLETAGKLFQNINQSVGILPTMYSTQFT